MIVMLNDKAKRHFKKILDDRFHLLREEVAEELIQSDDENYSELAGQVHDLAEEAVADLLVDLQFANLDRHIAEIREIDAALMRLATNEFGQCIDCNDEIEIERLEAYPTAKRCQPCQVSFENLHPKTTGPKF